MESKLVQPSLTVTTVAKDSSRLPHGYQTVANVLSTIFAVCAWDHIAACVAGDASDIKSSS